MKQITTLVAAGAFALTGSALVAHENVKNPAVKARMDLMTGIGAGMKTLGDMAKGQVDFDAAAAQAAVDAIATAAAQIPAAFEAQEIDPKSDAADAIWENWDDFVTKSEALATAAGGTTITDAGSLGAAMGAIGGTCGACHRGYKL